MSSYKIIKSGHIVEVYEYEKALTLDKEINSEKKKSKGGRKKEGETGKEERKDEYRGAVNMKARLKIRRLIQSNFNEGSLFITMTFAENMQDMKAANYELKKFIQKLKRKQENFKHVTVVEFQKRGAIHYHMICNLDIKWFSENELKQQERDLAVIWGNGFVDIKEIDHVDNVGAYLVKYMTKLDGDPRLDGNKRYFFTRDLEQPQEIAGESVKAYLDTFEGAVPNFTSDYENKFTGKVRYREYNLKQDIFYDN